MVEKKPISFTQSVSQVWDQYGSSDQLVRKTLFFSFPETACLTFFPLSLVFLPHALVISSPNGALRLTSWQYSR